MLHESFSVELGKPYNGIGKSAIKNPDEMSRFMLLSRTLQTEAAVDDSDDRSSAVYILQNMRIGMRAGCTLLVFEHAGRLADAIARVDNLGDMVMAFCHLDAHLRQILHTAARTARAPVAMETMFDAHERLAFAFVQIVDVAVCEGLCVAHERVSVGDAADAFGNGRHDPERAFVIELSVHRIVFRVRFLEPLGGSAVVVA